MDNVVDGLRILGSKLKHFQLVVLPRFAKSDYIIYNAHDTRVIRLSFERFARFCI